MIFGSSLTTDKLNEMALYDGQQFVNLGNPFESVIAIPQEEPRGDNWTAACALSSVSEDPLIKSIGESMKFGRTCVIDEKVATLKIREEYTPENFPSVGHDILLSRGLHCPGFNEYRVIPTPSLCIIHATKFEGNKILRGERVLSTPPTIEKIMTHFNPLRVVGSETIKDRELSTFLNKKVGPAAKMAAATLPEKVVDFLVKRLSSFGVTSPNSSMIGPEVTTQLFGLSYASAIAVASRLKREDILPKRSEGKTEVKSERKTAAQIVASGSPRTDLKEDIKSEGKEEKKFLCKKCKKNFKDGKALDQHNRFSKNHGKTHVETPRVRVKPPPPPPPPFLSTPAMPVAQATVPTAELTYSQQLEKYQYELALAHYNQELKEQEWTEVKSRSSRSPRSDSEKKKNPLVDALKKTLGGGFYDLQKACKYFKKGKIVIPENETVESIRAELLN